MPNNIQTKTKHLLLGLFILVCATANAQVNADFSSDEVEGCSPLVVQFINQSTGINLSYNWSFGNTNAGCATGPMSTLENPGRIYTQAGEYCVCLTVTDPSGATDTECKTNLISVFASPEADLSASTVIGCAPLTIDFTDQSIMGSGTIISWQWDLNNGNCPSSNTPTVSCTYDVPGVYDISLIVQDDNGCFHFIEKENFVTVYETMTSDFVPDNTGSCQTPFTVNFDPLLTNTQDVVFEWSFGDGNTSNQENPSHVYTTTGDFSVTLITTNTTSGCTDTTTYQDLISIGNLVDFSFDLPNGCEDLTINFTDNTPGTVTNWQWDFGDGMGTSTNANPTYTYTVPGCYTVTLQAVSDGCAGLRTSTNCIEVYESPMASYTSNNLLGCELPHTATFSGSSNLVNSTYLWDFGDGETSSLQNPVHNYSGYGNFPVTLTAISSDGCENSVTLDTVSIQVFNISLQADSVSGCVPLDIELTATSNLAFPITNMDWDFGNGTFGTGNPANVIYSDTGTYIISAMATNSLGCMDTTLVAVEAGQPLNIDFIADPTISCAEDEISFTDLTQGEVDIWFWEFGDGGISIDQNPVHMYQDTGVFTVCLTVANNGCFNQFCKTDYITILPPIANFDFSRNCLNPFYIGFTDNSIGADSWIWNFGVANSTIDTSTQVNPDFTFPGTGTYSVQLVVFNDLTGCTDTISKPVIITDPIANFEIMPDTGCAPLTVSISDFSQDADEYLWFAPGASIQPNASSANPTFVYENEGIYSGIGLIIEDQFGCLDTLMKNDTILVSDIDPGFTSTFPEGCFPLEVTFSDTSSSYGADIVSWYWDFGDGTTDTIQNPIHVFNSKGLKDVSLTVTNALGCSQTITLADYVFITEPKVRFKGDTILCTNQSFTFTNTTVAAVPATYFWEFGDGSTSVLKNPTYSYTAEGMYDVCLTVTDRYGCDSTLCKIDYIRVADPLAQFTADTTYASCPPLEVNFSDLSSNAVEWIWDFGDNSATINTPNTSHIYTEPGSYDVCLIITSPSGCLDTICKQDYIVIDGPKGDFGFLPDHGCAPLEVTLYGTGVDVVKYIWDSGCGDIEIHNNPSPTDTVTFVYDEAGTCYPILVVEDFQGCQRTIVSPDPIIVDELTSSIITTPSILCGSGVVNYESDVFSSANPVQYTWLFPGGTPSSSSNPSETVTYSNIGAYDVSLIVTNGVCIDTINQANMVIVADDPVADFSQTSSSYCVPSLVDFTDLSTVSIGTITNWVWDFGTGDSSTVQNPDYTYVNPGTYTVSLTVTSSMGCEHTITQVIETFPIPVADAGPDAQLCLGETVVLAGAGDGAYQWSPATGLSCSTCPDPVANPTNSTNYILTVTNAAGCYSTDTTQIVVSQYPKPDLNIIADTTVCVNSYVQIFATSSQGGVHFDWDASRPGLSCYENCFNPFATPTETTTYVVTVTNAGGCSTIDSITIVVLDNDTEMLGPDRTICPGGEVTLNSTNGFSPSWSPSNGLSCINCSNPIASPQETTTYFLEATSSEGCLLMDTITVNVFDITTVEAGVNRIVCLGDTTQLKGSATGKIYWTPFSTLSSDTILEPMAFPTATTIYTMTAVNDQCTVTDEMTVYVRESITIEAEDAEICIGDTAILVANGQAENYTWSGVDIDNPSGEQIGVAPIETTTYTVVGTLGSCTSDTTFATVIVNDPPELNAPTSYSFFSGEEFSIDVAVDGANGYAYTWAPEDLLSCTNCPKPTILADSSAIIMVTVTDENGCQASENINIILRTDCSEDLIVLPNAFTPNGDGLNDMLYARGSAISSLSLFRVYDRWGQLVFETSDKGIGWDGTYKGKQLNPGVFVYYVEAPCNLDGSKIVKKGNVTLIR